VLNEAQISEDEYEYGDTAPYSFLTTALNGAEQSTSCPKK
jgi:hypothetical protein